MKRIQMIDISHRYGDKQVLQHFSLKLEPGQTTCLLGPSGIGKTTVLNLLAGLEAPTQGVIEGKPYTVSCLFQDLRLLPWRSAAGNISFVLKGHVTPDVLENRTEAMLRLVELWEERSSHPQQLSGGMRQRVALARALAVPADLLLLDEPFKGLDIALRARIIQRCRALWQSEGATVLLVTHDPEEARALGATAFQLDVQGLTSETLI